MSRRPVRVLIVDDHAMIRRGLKAYFIGRSDIVLAGEAVDGQEAADTVAAVQPDVVLMDVNMPRLDGVQATSLIRQRYPAVKVIMLTSTQELSVVEAALQAGASGYLLKDVEEEDLAAAIRLVHAGHTLVPPGAAPAPSPALTAPPPAPTHGLSQREGEILALMVAGLSNKEIAHSTSLSISTVKFHVSNIIAKLGASSRTEATAVALRERLL
jgi:two-component system, NarL family, response regulator LiaR